jgi:transposase
MPRYRTAYPPEFRRQMVDLVRSGRTPEELAREFEPTAQSISTWVKHGGSASGPRGSSNCGGTTQRQVNAACHPAATVAAMNRTRGATRPAPMQ